MKKKKKTQNPFIILFLVLKKKDKKFNSQTPCVSISMYVYKVLTPLPIQKNTHLIVDTV